MTEVALVLILVFFVLLVCNVPVAVAIGAASLAAVFANGGMAAPELIVADRMVSGVSSFSLLARTESDLFCHRPRDISGIRTNHRGGKHHFPEKFRLLRCLRCRQTSTHGMSI